MRTCVRVYVIFDPARPHIALDAAGTLDSIATLLASRPESGLTVCVNQDGLTHALGAEEERLLEKRLSQTRSGGIED